MTSIEPTPIKLEGVRNVRDLGGIPVGEGRVVAPGLIFRGGALARATVGDRAFMAESLHIGRVIDLRCGWERAESPDPAIDGAENLHIPFYDLDIVGIEYTEPAAGTKVVGRDVACDPCRFYYSLSNPLTAAQMRTALMSVFEFAAAGKGVYMHCSGGKDRVGVLALLALTALGAGEDDILGDYLATNASRDKRSAEMLNRFLKFTSGDVERARELVESHRANPANLEAFYQSVDDRYGGMDVFMGEVLGVSGELRAHWREKCTLACESLRAAS